MIDEWKVILPYGLIEGVPRHCSMGGQYMMVEQSTTEPLKIRFCCWCGVKMVATAFGVDEVARLIATRSLNS